MYKQNMGGLVIDHQRSFGNEAMLCAVKPYNLYTDSRRTDTVAGHKYIAIFPKRPYQYVDVKIPGKQLMDINGNWIRVSFNNLCIKTYCDDAGNVRLTAKADGVKRIDT